MPLSSYTHGNYSVSSYMYTSPHSNPRVLRIGESNRRINIVGHVCMYVLNVCSREIVGRGVGGDRKQVGVQRISTICCFDSSSVQ